MRELTFSLSDLLRDEVTLAVLRADGVPMETFQATLHAAAKRLPASQRPALPAPKERAGWLAVTSRLGIADQLCCGA